MHVAVTAVGADRPGIVAAVTRVLYDVGGNIEDSRSAILGGHFAMMLIVALPPNVSPAALEDALAAAAGALDLIVTVRPVADARAGHDEGAPHVVSVYGSDRPGIVAQVSEALAAAGANVRDLATHVVGEAPAVYVMLMEVSLPDAVDTDALRDRLAAIASDLGVEVSLHPVEAETL